jgi:biopolymer transport protein ExbD
MTNLEGAGTRCEINVTPLIDILLVLLIVFMIITPLTSNGLPAFAPQKDSNASVSPAEPPIVLELLNDHSLRINSHELSVSDLQSEISNIYSRRPNRVLFLEADQDLEYRDVAHLIDLVRGINPTIQIALSKRSPSGV